MLLRGIYSFFIIPWGLKWQFQHVFGQTGMMEKLKMAIPGFLEVAGKRERL
jgi:hypothetical protein